MYYELTDHFEVNADAEKSWAFFADATNLPKITPPWRNFTVDTPGKVAIGQDSLIDYTIRWMGIPVKWRTRIIDWSPPRQFIDLQVRGPYALWHHQHTFGPGAGGGTACRDRVIYRLPFGPLGRIGHPLVVKRQLLEIFNFRRKVIADQLGGLRAVQQEVTVRRI